MPITHPDPVQLWCDRLNRLPQDMQCSGWLHIIHADTTEFFCATGVLAAAATEHAIVSANHAGQFIGHGRPGRWEYIVLPQAILQWARITRAFERQIMARNDSHKPFSTIARFIADARTK